jgi:parvulin-like peptidyl-prolyl isomerase
MEQVLAQEILRQYAVSHGITVTSGQINAQIQSDTRQLGGTAALHAQMAQVGLTMASYRSLLEANLLGRAVEARVTPLQKKPQPDAHVRHILIALQPQGKAPRTDAQAHALAQQVLARVQRGANFAALARKDSDDPGSATKGGDLGNIYRGQTVKPFEQAAFTLPLNRPALVHTVFGYHIVEVLARGSSVMPLQYQQQQQNQAFNTWLTGRLKAAKIQRIAALAPQG